MNKPKVIVHGNVPQEAIDAALKIAEEMGLDEIDVSSPELTDEVKESLKKRGRTLDGISPIMGDGEVLPPDLARLLIEALGANVPYNGVEGDSCDCPPCNLRRKEVGPELGRDEEMGIPKERYAHLLNAGPGKDVIGTPMFRMPKLELKNPFPKDSVFNKPCVDKESSMKGIDELLEVIRVKQDKHFKVCDELSDSLQEVRKLIGADKPMEAFLKLQEVEKILDELKA